MLDTGACLVARQAGPEPRRVQSETLGIRQQVLAAESLLIIEQQIVVGPELSLLGSTLCSHRRQTGVRMQVRWNLRIARRVEWEVTEYDTDCRPWLAENVFETLMKGGAVSTFKI